MVFNLFILKFLEFALEILGQIEKDSLILLCALAVYFVSLFCDYPHPFPDSGYCLCRLGDWELL